MKVLVTYGSSRGGTEGLAQMVAHSFADEGFDVDVEAAEKVNGLADYDAVIVGGALYMLRWHKSASRFVRQHVGQLRRRPVYFFSSGPLDDSASRSDIAPVKGVSAMMERCGARGHATFGGRLQAEAQGFLANAMTKRQAGDWRDPEQVSAWVSLIAAQLRELAAQPGQSTSWSDPPSRRVRSE